MKINEIILQEWSDWDESERKPDPRSRPAQDHELEDIKIKCSQAFNEFRKGKFIYKGFSYGLTGDFYFTDPSLKLRSSANTKNYYTMLMDNLPNWSKYPKRSKSLICTTSLSTARSYSNPYYVLPFDGAKFGVCSGNDLWVTELNISTQKVYMEDLNNFYSENYVPDIDYTHFIEYFFRNKNQKFTSFNGVFLKEFKKIKDVKNISGVIKFFEYLYDPKRLGFTLKTITTLPRVNREIWTDSKAYLIRVNSELSERLKNENQ